MYKRPKQLLPVTLQIELFKKYIHEKAIDKFRLQTLFILLTICAIFYLKAQPISDNLIEDFNKELETAELALEKDPAEARLIINQLIKNIEKQETPSVPIADLWHKIGNWVYSNYNDYTTSLACFEKALAHREKLLEPQHPDLARNYFMVGLNKKYLRDYVSASYYIEKALNISQTHQNTFMLTSEYFELGEIQDLLGDYDKSLHFYELAYSFALKTDKKRAYFFVEYFKRIASIQLLKSRHQEALTLNKRAIQICKDSAHVEFSSHFNRDIADCYINMNLSYQALHQLDSAHICLQQALKFYTLFPDAGTDIDIRTANVYLEKGSLFLEQLQLNNAIEQYLKAVSVLEKINPNHAYLSSAYSGLGNVYLKKNNPLEAIPFFKKALEIVAPNHTPSVSAITTVSDKCLIALHGIAQCQKTLNQVTEAMTSFKQLDTLISNLRSSLKEDGSKFSLAEQALPIYENAIETALLVKDTISALDFCERNKAIVLREALQDLTAKQIVKVTPSVSNQEKALKEQITYYQKQRFDSNDSLKGIWQDSIQRSKTALETLIKNLEHTEPHYFKQKYAPIRSLAVAEIQEYLAPHSMVLEYFIGKKQQFIFAISKDKVKTYTLNLPPQYQDTILQFLKAIKNTAPDVEALNICAATAHSLFNMFLKQPLNDFNSDNRIARLRIIPDGVLNYIPFDALIEQNVTDLKRPDVPYVLRKYAVSYIVSNQLLKPSPAPNLWNTWTYSTFGGFGINYKNTPLNHLPFAESEVEQLGYKLGGDVFTQSQKTALKTVFLKKASNYRLLHLSMHGVLDDREPLKSALMFVGENDSLDPLQVLDINTLEFSHNELTVLSACNTGSGILQHGEGIMSLSRAFLQAGSQSLVMSLWTLQDAFTSEILTCFYSNLEQNQPKDIALAEAKRQFLTADQSERRVPNYWASMALMGSIEPLDISHNHYYRYILAVLALVLIFYIVKKRNFFK